MTADARMTCVELGHCHSSCAGSKLGLREGVDLSAHVDKIWEERVLIRGNVEAVGIGTDVGIVTEARAAAGAVVVRRTPMVWRAVSAVILNGHAVNCPATRW